MATISSPSSAISLRNLLSSRDAALALGLVLIVGMLIVPLPAAIVDLLIALNLAISLGILLLTLYVEKPMHFSVFPTILLLTTLFRLGINISTSRLILMEGNAGMVVDTFGNLLVGGNYVIGVIVFLMLMVIQWIVINNGTGRVAEVAARFTLDAMPGKQMSIDADLNAGMIDEHEARIRRQNIQKEADFYGSMDGASKFVKGDAMAGIIIMIINVLGGFIIGMMQLGLSLDEALANYTLVTIGAGLAGQIPALLVSAAAGMLATRSSSEQGLSSDILGQLSNLNVLVVGSVIIGLIGLVPGIPKLPFLGVAALLGVGAYFAWRNQQKPDVIDAPADVAPPAESGTPQDMLEMLVVDPMELEVGYALIGMVDDTKADNLLRRITSIRRQLMNEMGLVLPVVRVRDNLHLQPQTYRVKIRGEEVARGELMLERMLAIPGSQSEGRLQGIPTTEPAFGLPALWITEAEKGRAELMGYTVVTPLSVLSTHLTEVSRRHAPLLIDRQTVQEMIDQLRLKTPAAIEGVIPELITLGGFQAVLRNLLSERIPIRDLGGILEVVASNVGMTRDPNILAEAVRQTMARTISNQYRDPDGYLHVFTLSPELESMLRNSLGPAENGFNFQIDANLAQSVLVNTGEQMERMASEGYFPVMLCSREVRLAFRRLVERSLPNLVVLAYSEISTETRVKAHGMVEMPQP